MLCGRICVAMNTEIEEVSLSESGTGCQYHMDEALHLGKYSRFHVNMCNQVINDVLRYPYTCFIHPTINCSTCGCVTPARPLADILQGVIQPNT